MNLHAQKLELVQLILNTNHPGLLEKVGQLLKQEENNDWWDDLPSSVQEAIIEGDREADRGETTPHEVDMSEVRKKYSL